MVRSAAGGGGHVQDGHDAAAAALARLSSSLKPATTQRLPAGVVSVRVLLIILVVLLSLGVLIPIVSRSKNELDAVTTTVHSVPRMPRTANLHVDQTNWKRYTLRQAAQVKVSSIMNLFFLVLVMLHFFESPSIFAHCEGF